jgi:hypothetical protein
VAPDILIGQIKPKGGVSLWKTNARLKARAIDIVSNIMAQKQGLLRVSYTGSQEQEATRSVVPKD